MNKSNLGNEDKVGCRKMFCFIEGCGKIDETHTAYCIKHGRSPHRICGESEYLCKDCKTKLALPSKT